MPFAKPSVTVENFTREAQSIFINPFSGIKSSVNINRAFSLTIENQNLKSNFGLLYSTSNFLSSIFLDQNKNIILKNMAVKDDFIVKNVVVLNKAMNPYYEFGLSMNKIINFNLNFIKNHNVMAKSSFLFKYDNLHAGLEINSVNKYENTFLFRIDNFKSIFTMMMRYDILNLTLCRKINEFLSIASEVIANEKSVFSKIGLCQETQSTTVKLEINTLMNVILSIERKIYESFVVSICSEMKEYGVFDNGFAINLEI